RNEDENRINRALDIVVNHLLVNSFGFDRSRIRDQDVLCWTDTVFKDDPKMAEIPTDESYEYYFQKIPETLTVEVYLVDDHSGLRGEVDKIIGKINGRLTPEEKESLEGIIKKHYADGGEGSVPVEHGGCGCGNWTFVSVENVSAKRKW